MVRMRRGGSAPPPARGAPLGWWPGTVVAGPTHVSPAWERLGHGWRQVRLTPRLRVRFARRVADAARWLLAFAARDLGALTPADWLALWEETLRCLNPMPLTTPEATARVPPGLREAARWFQGWVRRGLVTLAEGGEWHFQTRRTHGLSVNRFGMLQPFLRGKNLPDQFREAAFRALEEARDLFRSCEECRRPFIGRKRQAYCTPGCSQKVRTRRYRTRRRGGPPPGRSPGRKSRTG